MTDVSSIAWPVPVADWPALSPLFDELLDLAPAAREAWLACLPPESARHREALEKLCRQLSAVETNDFLTRPVAAASPPTQVGPYRLLRELGRGGMSRVWLAERSDSMPRRAVALKLPHASLATSSFADRLARERDILASLEHPHIARLYDAGVSAEGQPYLALEYVAGREVLAYATAQSLGVRARIELFRQVLAAVQYAHSRLVIHRDLKPANVLVDEQGSVRLLDFGIAKLMGETGQAMSTELTELGGSALTPSHASPEQIAGRPLGTSSDVYSLGVLLFELLTGERPYRLKRGSRAELEEAILGTEPRRPSDAAPALRRVLRGDLDAIVLKALAKPPEQRYATAEAFQGDLQRYLDGEPVLAQPERRWYRMAKFVRRHRLAFGLGMVVLLALAAALAAALWQARQARVEARTAEATLAFIEDIFNANSSGHADPARARQTPARELLDIGRQRIETALTDSPDARLRVATTLARLYDDLDLRAEVVALHGKRVDLARALRGPDDTTVADALVDVAGAADDNDQDALAAQSLQEAGALLDRRHDEHSPSRARLEAALCAHLGFSGGALDDALRHGQRAVALFRPLPPSEDAVGALDALAHVQIKLGHLDEAARALAEALQLADRVPGGMKGRMAYLWQSAGDLAMRRDDFGQAQQDLERALAAAEANSGAGSTTALSVLSDLGYMMVGASEFGPAVDRLAEAARRAQALAGTVDASSVEPIVFRRYAAALTHFGRPEEALDALRVARRLWKGELTVDEEALLLGETVSAEIELGHLAAARAALDQREDQLRRRASGMSGRTNETVMMRVQLLVAAGEAAQAASVLASYEPEARAVPGSRLALTRSLAQAEVNAASSQWEQALVLANAVLTETSANPRAARLKRLEAGAHEIAGVALLRKGRAAMAWPELRKGLDLALAMYDADHSPRLAQAMVALGECELSLGHRTEARTLLDRARAIHARHAELGPQYQRPLQSLAARLGR